MVEFKNQIEWIEVDSLKPTPNNPNYVPAQIMTSLTNHIKKEGFYGAVIVNDNNEVVDGWHRTMALKTLGAKKIPVIKERNWDKNQSRLETVRFNREHGFLTPIETGNLLNDTKIPIDILAKQTDIPMSELPELLDLTYDPIIDKSIVTEKPMSWSEVEKMISVLTGKIKETKQKFDKIYTVGRGGLIPARLLADRLGIKEIVVDEIPPEGSLFVDDILDSGKTFRKYGKKVLYAVLYLRLGYECPKNVLYAQLTPDDNYIDFVWEKTESKK